jgi:Tfp pilus assembly protein PilV
MAIMQKRREGFALAGAVLAMVLVGAIVTGGFYAAHQESQITRSAEIGDMALYVAEQGLDATIANTSSTTLNAMAVDGTINPYTNNNVSFGGRVIGNYSTTVTRLTAKLFVVRSSGRVTVGGAIAGATRTVSNVVKVRTADFDNNTAMQVYGNLTVGGNSSVDGNDAYHASWTGCSLNGSSSAVTAQPSATITTQGSGSINGPVTRQTMDSTFFTMFGDVTYADLTRMASITYTANANVNPAAVTVGVTCDKTNTSNWGEPTIALHPCFTYFPIIYAQGDLSIQSNGRGQGLLLVDGNLSIQGQFAFYGPIVVRGQISVAGTADIFGSVLAYGGGNINTTSALGVGTSVVKYSSCALARATQGLEGLQVSVPIRNRSFMDLTAVRNSY